MQIKPIQAGDGIRELVARNDAGIVVYALSPGERSLNLEAMVQPLHDTQLESMIGGTGCPVQITDIAGQVVDLRGRIPCGRTALRVGNALVSAGIDLRPEVAGGSQLWHNQIAVVDTEWLMNPPRPNVTNRRREVAKDFVLDVEVPLHHIVAVRMGFQRPVLGSAIDRA